VRVPLSRRTRDESGAVALMAALMMLVIALLAGFVVDFGAACVAKGQQQTAADAAALAGGGAVFEYDGDLPDFVAAEAAAKSLATQNADSDEPLDWAGCSDQDHLPIVLSTQCISFQMDALDVWVRVKMPTHVVETTFGQLAGVSVIDVGAAARSTIRRGGASRCGLCVIGSGLQSLSSLLCMSRDFPSGSVGWVRWSGSGFPRRAGGAGRPAHRPSWRW
jgi:hypothetical protein